MLHCFGLLRRVTPLIVPMILDIRRRCPLYALFILFTSRVCVVALLMRQLPLSL